MSAITSLNFILCARIANMTGRARFITDSGFERVCLTRLALTIMRGVARSQFRGANSTHLTICTFGVAMTSDACGAFVSLTWCFGVQFGWAQSTVIALLLTIRITLSDFELIVFTCARLTELISRFEFECAVIAVFTMRRLIDKPIPSIAGTLRF